MALQIFDLNRAGDTPIATLKLVEQPVKAEAPFRAVDNGNPVYVAPNPTYYGGDYGDDQDEASANATTNYQPRNQESKATMMGNLGIAKDVGRARGRIDARQPYPVAGDPPLVDAAITTITPNTVVANTGKYILLVIGVGFTQWTLFRGEGRIHDLQSDYITPTLAHVLLDSNLYPPGVYALQAVDHNTESATVPFTLT